MTELYDQDQPESPALTVVPDPCNHWRLEDDEACPGCGKTTQQMRDEKNAERAAALVAGLRAAADWYEQHPEYAERTWGGARLDMFFETKDQLLAFKHASGATRHEKGAVPSYFWLRRDFGGGIVLDANIPREKACRKVVVGTREVPAETIEAHVEEVIEWQCDPLLSDPEEATV